MKSFVAIAAITAALVAIESRASANGTDKELRLSDAIDEALKNNPTIEVFQNRVQSARARGNQAGYLEDPELNFEAWGIPLNQPTSIRSANPLIFGLRQKVPFFGKRALKNDIAESEVQMSEEDLRMKQVEIIAKVKSAYADYFLAHKAIEIARAHLELNRQLSATAENLYKVGKAPQQDVIKALLEHTDLLNRLNMAERELEMIQARLNALLNRRVGAPVGPPAEIRFVRLSSNFEELENLAANHNPELRGLERNLKKSETIIELAQRNRKYPDFMLGLQYWVAPDQKPKHMYTPMVSLTIPFSPWTKGKHDNEIEEALSEKRVAKAQFDAMKNSALLAIREMFVKARAAEKSVGFYQDGLLPQAQYAFDAAVAAYQTGQVNFVNMLDAQRTIREARLGYYKALVDYEQSVVDIEKTVGVILPRQSNN